jgi:hypothetical protein
MKRLCLICKKEMGKDEDSSFHASCLPPSKPLFINSLVDIKIVCDPPSDVVNWWRTQEDRERALEKWCREFNQFIRDHRSQDYVFLYTEKTYEKQCVFCERPWELDEDGPTCCGIAQEEYDKRKVLSV